MPEFTVEQLIEGLGEAGLGIKGAKVTVLGLSYKANVADDRESPSYKLVTILKGRGAIVNTFDPYSLENSSSKSLKEAIGDKDAIVVATNHKEFMDLGSSKLDCKVFVDGKNAFDREALEKQKIIYKGIGS
jgi:UDP-N-acetyl-D-glucosamine dehydrogenase